jgi:DNA-binding response OmpR family regulator
MVHSGKTHTVLIVDDEERLRKALERSLLQEGYQTRVAASGDEALALVQAEPVDLLITDLVMPGMDGMALVRAIRAFNTEMKVVILTAYGSVESQADAEELGVAYYLTKPFDLFHLKSRVKRLLRSPEAAVGVEGKQVFCAVCATMGQAIGTMSAWPRTVRPYVQPKRWLSAAGSAAGTVSGLCSSLWRRISEAR